MRHTTSCSTSRFSPCRILRPLLLGALGIYALCAFACTPAATPEQPGGAVSNNTAQPDTMFNFLRKSAADSAKVVRLSAEQYKAEHTGKGTVIDVRTPAEVAGGRLRNAKHIDVQSADFKARVDSLDRDGVYYLYCRSGNRSGKAADLMAGMGFRNLYNIGGYDALAAAGLPVERP